MIIHGQPAAGKYASVVAYREDESGAPEAEFPVASAFRE
jgi:hypothetical protein